MGDRADRLSQRRKDRSTEQPAAEQPAEQNRQAEQEKPEQLEELEKSGQPEQQETVESAKDLYKGTYIYLPPDLRTEFDLVANELDTRRQRRNGKKVEKIRHFEPLVVALGLDQIDALDEGELEQRLAEFDPE